MTISTLITDRLIWYTFKVYYCGRVYTFRDSMKKIIGSLEKAAKDFDLPIRKGSINYTASRPEGYIPTPEEIDYIHIDTEIMGDILTYYYDNGMIKMTNASDAMNEYKNLISPHQYKAYFPVLIKPFDDFIRKSYKGGFCFVNPKYTNVDLDKVYCYDVKSMYPSVMRYAPLPYGMPIHYFGMYEDDQLYPLFIQKIRVVADLKEGRIPSIQTKSFMSIKLNYLRTTNGRWLELYLTSVDLERFFDDYDITDIEFCEGFKFQATHDLFSTYIDKYFALKEQSQGAKKQLYKIFLNSLYGKFAMSTEKAKAYPELHDSVMKFKKTAPEETDAIYTAVASFITSWARKKLLDGIYANLDYFVYCDTDSMHLLKPVQGVTEGKQLGQWAIEHGKKENGITMTTINYARYLGQKCYLLSEQDDKGNKLIKKVAGAPEKVKEAINFDNFYYNFTSDASAYPKYRMKQVKGGVVLVPTSFTIKEKKVL